MSSEAAHQAVRELLALPPLPREPRARLVGAAMTLFSRYGIRAVGLDRILANAGSTKATFDEHFDGKDELVVAALRARDAWELEAWIEAVEVIAGSKPREQLLGLFEMLDILFQSADYRGCAFINAAAEFVDPNHPVHRAAMDHKRATWRWVRDLAQRAGAGDADAFADAYTMLLDGALVARHVRGCDDAARVAQPTVKRLIELHVP